MLALCPAANQIEPSINLKVAKLFGLDDNEFVQQRADEMFGAGFRSGDIAECYSVNSQAPCPSSSGKAATRSHSRRRVFSPARASISPAVARDFTRIP